MHCGQAPCHLSSTQDTPLQNTFFVQIARIVATTSVGPVGYLTAGEDGALTKNEEYAPKDWTEVAGADAWCHQRPHLKKQGVRQ